MSSRIRGHHLVSSLACCLAVLVWLPSAARAEKLLRWKFQKGDQRTTTIAQNTNIAMTKGQRTTNVKMQQTLVLRQLVEDVDDQGNATIQNQFERILMNVEAAPEKSFNYDSAAPENPRGRAAKIAPILKTLAKSEFTTKISPRGKILEVELPQDFVAMVEGSPDAKESLFDLSSKEGFEQLMKHSAAVFPDQPVAKDDEWTDKVEIDAPTIGKQIVSTTYSYEGEQDVEGKPLDKIDLSVMIAFTSDESAPSQVTPKEQKTSGALWFDAEAGQLVRGNVEQKMNMEVTVGAEKVQTQITGDLDIKVTTKAPSE